MPEASKPSKDFKRVKIPPATKWHLVRVKSNGTISPLTLSGAYRYSDRTLSENILTGNECRACRDAMYRQPRLSAQNRNSNDYEIHHQIDD
jgi:hypothetical protein